MTAAHAALRSIAEFVLARHVAEIAARPAPVFGFTELQIHTATCDLCGGGKTRPNHRGLVCSCATSWPAVV